MSVRNALFKYSQKQMAFGKNTRSKKNQKPEREVEKAVMKWLGKNGFSVSVVESKSTYSTAAGRYTSGNACPGFSDIVGCDTDGYAVFIELKAVGKRSTMSEVQRVFLSEKIKHNAFAMVCDSVCNLDNCYDKWRCIGVSDRRKFLFNMLPKARKKARGDDLFE